MDLSQKRFWYKFYFCEVQMIDPNFIIWIAAQRKKRYMLILYEIFCIFNMKVENIFDVRKTWQSLKFGNKCVILGMSSNVNKTFYLF